MKERPILFSSPMVRAILAGTKSQTRRVVVPQPPAALVAPEEGFVNHDDAGVLYGRQRVLVGDPENPDIDVEWERFPTPCPYGVPGDRLWVRETWGCREADRPGVPDGRKPRQGDRILYAANDDDAWQWRDGSLPWRPSIHMPRWASRITLEVTGVRVERVQDITESDARAEGARPSVGEPAVYESLLGPGTWNESARGWFADLWESINAARGFGWDANPWVWVIEFRRVA